jgi:DNA-3-methyladenine glycosylase II
MTAQTINHGPARRHLGRKDSLLKELMRRVGPCTLTIDTDRFGILARSIISQQISTKAARSIHARLLLALPKGKLKPANVLALADEQMRAAGLSANKVRSLRDLAEKVHGKTVPLARLHKMDDEDVVAHLVTVRGIGRWTAEMFLIFSLGRLDILPVDDLGLRAGVREVYALPELPDKASLLERGEAWRPYRSIATWYFWRSRGDVPQSKG